MPFALKLKTPRIFLDLQDLVPNNQLNSEFYVESCRTFMHSKVDFFDVEHLLFTRAIPYIEETFKLNNSIKSIYKIQGKVLLHSCKI